MEIETNYLGSLGKVVIRFNANKIDGYQVELDDNDVSKLMDGLKGYFPEKDKNDSADTLSVLKSAVDHLDWLTGEHLDKDMRLSIHKSHIVNIANQLRERLPQTIQIGEYKYPVRADESMPTNEIHVFGADGKKVIVKF